MGEEIDAEMLPQQRRRRERHLGSYAGSAEYSARESSGVLNTESCWLHTRESLARAAPEWYLPLNESGSVLVILVRT